MPKRLVITSEHQFRGSLSTTIADTELFIPEDDPARKRLMHTIGMMRGIADFSYQPAIIRISAHRSRCRGASVIQTVCGLQKALLFISDLAGIQTNATEVKNPYYSHK